MDIVIRAAVIYAVVFVFTRAIGRRELSALQPFDLILLIVIGDLIQNGVTQNDLSVTGVLLALCTIGALQVLTSYLGFRFRRIRPVIQGEPIVLVENGRTIDHNMRRERLTLDDLAEKARISEIETLDEIKWAVLETNGEISFIKQAAR
ncbi:MAG TPA: YetF domain-containing protein [Streptosporangiaceae bacterium]|nr:YetF domain-containing protein [Streptosporangiaceae bacterium]